MSRVKLQGELGVLLEIQLICRLENSSFEGNGNWGVCGLWHHILAVFPPLPKHHVLYTGISPRQSWQL